MASRKVAKNGPMPPKAKKAYNEISQATYANLMTQREKSMGKSPSASTRRATAADRKYVANLKAGDLSSSPKKMYSLKNKARKQGQLRYAQSVRPSSLRQTRKKKDAR